MSVLPTLPRMRVALVGAGRVGTTVAYHLRGSGHRIASVSSRSTGSAERAARYLEAPVTGDLRELPVVDLVLVGVTESAIPDVARELALVVAPGTMVVHLAGVFGVAPLDAIGASGARPAALHPVQAIPDIERGIERLPGSAWGVTCAPPDREWAHSLIANDLRGEPVDVWEEDRPLWHAASVATSNGIAGLLSVGERILASLGIDRPERVLGPLAEGTLINAREGGGGGATLTGPVVRGEVATISRHLMALEARDDGLARAYALAAHLVLDAARAGGRIDPPAADGIDELLGEHR